MRAYCGTLTEPGRDSPYRDPFDRGEPRPVPAHARGQFGGARTPAREDRHGQRQHDLRDPALYRIKHVEHQNTGNAGPVYPMYDFAHSLSVRWKASPIRCARWSSRTTARWYDWCVDKCWTSRIRRQLRPLTDQGIRSKPPSRARSILAPEFQLAGDEQAQAAANWSNPAASAGTTRACPPCRASAAAAIHRRRCARWWTGSASAKVNSLPDISILEGARCATTSMRTHARRMAVIDPEGHC